MEHYFPAEENKACILHLLVYAFTFIAGVYQILGKRYKDICIVFLGNGKKFIDDSSRFV